MSTLLLPSCGRCKSSVHNVVGCWTMLLLALLSTTCQALQPMPPVDTVSSSAASAFNVNVNVPSLLELVRTREARQSTLEKAAFLGQSARYLIPPEAVSVQPPTDMKGFVQQALSGQASLTLNAEGVGDKVTKVVQFPQQVDVQILASDWGALTVQIRNPILPKLPLTGLPDTPPVVTNMVAPAVADAAPAALALAQTVVTKLVEADAAGPQPSFWDTPIQNGNVVVHFPNGQERAVTPLDILGTSSLTLGAAYAGSYAFYVAEQEREAREAEERKQEMAAKRKAAAAKKKKQGDEAKTKSTAEAKKNMTKPIKAKKIETASPAPKPINVENVDEPAKSATTTSTQTAKTATTSTVSQEDQVEATPVAVLAAPAQQQAVVLAGASIPQLQRSIPKEKSIAMAEKEDDKKGDGSSAPPPQLERKKLGIFARFKRIFRKES